MKVNIISLDEHKIEGYDNVYFFDIGNIIDNSLFDISIEENVLSQISNLKIKEFIQNLSSKLRHGGTLSISGFNIVKIFQSYLNGEKLDLSCLVNSAGFYNPRDIRDIFLENNLKIISFNLVENCFVIKGHRE